MAAIGTRRAWPALLLAAMAGGPQAHAALLANGGFEMPALAAPGDFRYGSPASWTATGQAGFTRVSVANDFTRGTVEPPDGRQVAFVQNRGRLTARFTLGQGGPVVVSFAATQRDNQWQGPQRLALWVDGLTRAFTLGGSSVPHPSVTPPSGHFEHYAVRLVLAAGEHEIALGGLTDVDSTAFVDTVGVSTPTQWAFGLWDPGLRAGRWRSDYAAAGPGDTSLADGLGGVLATGACVFGAAALDSGRITRLVPAGATLWPWLPCTGAPGQPGYAFSPDPSFWTHDGHVPGQPHWAVGVNNEFVAVQGGADGPPNQSARIVTAGGAPGTRIVVTDSGPDTQMVAASPGRIAHLIWNPPPTPSGKVPFASFSVNGVRGNGRPLAIADRAGDFRPQLAFNSLLADTDWRSFVTWWLVFVGGWPDGVPRGLLIATSEHDASGRVGSFVPNDAGARRVGWNWNVRNSRYHPGAVLAYFRADELQACGPSVRLPALPPGATLFTHGEAAARSARIDLGALLACVTDPARFVVPAWGGGPLPDPVVVRHLEWAIEANDEWPDMQGYVWLMTGDIRIEP